MLVAEKVKFIGCATIFFASIRIRSTRVEHLQIAEHRLVANQQLIRSVDGAEGSSSWGILLPSTFTPNSMAVSSSGRKAVLLLTDCVGTIIVFQLQRTGSEEPLVKCSLALYGGLNPGIEKVYLASASHDFDLEKQGKRFLRRGHWLDPSYPTFVPHE
jgi:hypothetical protein